MALKTGPSRDVLRRQPADELPPELRPLPEILAEVVRRENSALLQLFGAAMKDVVQQAVRDELDRREAK